MIIERYLKYLPMPFNKMLKTIKFYEKGWRAFKLNLWLQLELFQKLFYK